MRRLSFDAVEAVEVLVQSDLKNGNGSLSGGDDGRREEVDPDAVPADTVFGDDIGLVREPVLVPSPEGCRVVHAEHVDCLDLEVSAFDLTNNPVERAGGIGPGKIYLFMKRPQIRSSYCQLGRIPAT